MSGQSSNSERSDLSDFRRFEAWKPVSFQSEIWESIGLISRERSVNLFLRMLWLMAHGIMEFLEEFGHRTREVDITINRFVLPIFFLYRRSDPRSLSCKKHFLALQTIKKHGDTFFQGRPLPKMTELLTNDSLSKKRNPVSHWSYWQDAN